MGKNIVVDKAAELQKIISLTIEDPSKSKEVKINSIIVLASLVCAIVAVQPIPFADIFVLTPIQLVMVRYLGSVYGLNYDEHKLRDILTQLLAVVGWGVIAQLLAVVGWGVIAQQAILGLYKTILPFVSGVTTIPLVFIATYGLGYTMNMYLKSQAEGKQLSDEELKRIKKEAEAEIKKTHSKISLDDVKKQFAYMEKDALEFEQYKNSYNENLILLSKYKYDKNSLLTLKKRFAKYSLVAIEEYAYNQLLYLSWEEIKEFENCLFNIFNNPNVVEFGERLSGTNCFMLPINSEWRIYFTKNEEIKKIQFIGNKSSLENDLETIKTDFKIDRDSLKKVSETKKLGTLY